MLLSNFRAFKPDRSVYDTGHIPTHKNHVECFIDHTPTHCSTWYLLNATQWSTGNRSTSLRVLLFLVDHWVKFNKELVASTALASVSLDCTPPDPRPLVYAVAVILSRAATMDACSDLDIPTQELFFQHPSSRWFLVLRFYIVSIACKLSRV